MFLFTSTTAAIIALIWTTMVLYAAYRMMESFDGSKEQSEKNIKYIGVMYFILITYFIAYIIVNGNG